MWVFERVFRSATIEVSTRLTGRGGSPTDRIAVSMKNEQLELGSKLRDVWVDRLEKEFGIMLLPFFDKSFPRERCLQIVKGLVDLAAKRAREVKALAECTITVRCRGCDTEVDARAVVHLCGRCGEGIRSAGSDG
jgi:hypothetical protein